MKQISMQNRKFKNILHNDTTLLVISLKIFIIQKLTGILDDVGVIYKYCRIHADNILVCMNGNMETKKLFFK